MGGGDSDIKSGNSLSLLYIEKKVDEWVFLDCLPVLCFVFSWCCLTVHTKKREHTKKNTHTQRNTSMRLFVRYEQRTVIVALSDGAAMCDLIAKCKEKFILSDSSRFSLCLDMEEAPVVDSIDEASEDKLFVRVLNNSDDVNDSQLDKDSSASKEDSADEDDFKDDSDEDDFKDDSDEDDFKDDSNDDEYVEPSRKRRKTTTFSSPITMQAFMKQKSLPPSTTIPVDKEINERIRNILQRGLHPNTPEAEAANSMRLAERMLRKHNLSRVDVMTDTKNECMEGDLVRVDILNPKTDKPVCGIKQWIHSLAHTSANLFKCKTFHYIQKAEFCYFTFYGISSSAYAAALAFETSFNRIMTLVSQHTVPVEEYKRKRRNGDISVRRAVYTKTAKSSYCEGIASGLRARVNEAPSTTQQDDVAPEQETRLACITKQLEKDVLEKANITLGLGKTFYRYKSRRVVSFVAGQRDSSQINLDQHLN